MNKTLIPAQVHRFRCRVAVWLADGSTVYLAPADARRLAKALTACAADIKREPDFCKSGFPSTSFTFEGER